MSDAPAAQGTAPAPLPNTFVSQVTQICIVTRDYRRTIAGFLKLGIGPWRVYTLGPDTVSNMTYRGKPSPHVMKVCLATIGGMEWEIVQPVEGPTIYDEFLAEHGEGVHHVAVSCTGLTWAEKIARFEAQGFHVVQSGSWLGQMPYAYFETEDSTGTTFEIYDELADFAMPEPMVAEW